MQVKRRIGAGARVGRHGTASIAAPVISAMTLAAVIRCGRWQRYRLVRFMLVRQIIIARLNRFDGSSGVGKSAPACRKKNDRSCMVRVGVPCATRTSAGWGDCAIFRRRKSRSASGNA
jgi:hypothetical protein